MKKINLYSLLILTSIVLSFSACTDLAVEEIDSTVSENESGEFVGDGPALLASSYFDLSAMTDQANIYSLSAHTSDVMIPPTRGVDWGDNGVWRTLHAHTWDATHAFVLGAWNQLNQRVFKTTQALHTGNNPTLNESGVAEAKFLRAFYMYQVIDLFGQVPFREVNQGREIDPKVLNSAEALQFVLDDLNASIPNLSSIPPTVGNARASIATGNALKARVLLNKAVYDGSGNHDPAIMDEVIEACDAVAAEGYALDDYFHNFTTEAASEILFTVDPSSNGSPFNRIAMTTHYNQQIFDDNEDGGWNGFTTLSEFYDSFEDEDIRKGKDSPAAVNEKFHGIKLGFLIGQQYKDDGTELEDSRRKKPLSFTKDVTLNGADTDKGIRVMKYHPATAGNYILLRYADVHLMKAEAYMRKGDSGTALALVNELRAMRGASELGALTETEMLAERGRELHWEGIRRTDQIRFGTFTNAWQEKTSTEAHRVLFPIPSLALGSNPNLQQNPGY